MSTMEVERQLGMSLDDIIAKQKKARPVGGKKQTVITLTSLSHAIGEDHTVVQRQRAHLTCSPAVRVYYPFVPFTLGSHSCCLTIPP